MIAYIEDRLPAAPIAVAQARHALAVNLLPEVTEDVLETVLLLTTEAVSRALAATDEPWQLRADVRKGSLRVTVRYTSRPGAVDADGELRDVILDALSTAWGSAEAAGSTSLWFELSH